MAYSSINRVILIGRLTHDPELRALPSGTTVCSLRVACNSSRKTDDGYEDRPNYFNVSVFGARGESVSRYMRKGRRIAIDGRLEWREWETAEGARRQTVEVVAENAQFLDGPGEHANGNGGPAADLDAAGSDGGEDGDGEDASRELVGAGAGAEDALVF
jgi:single-strand DNA-binding protein